MTTLTLGPALEGLYDFAKGYDYTARLNAYKAKFQDILTFADNVGGQLTLSSITAQKIVLQSGSYRVEFTGAFAFTSTTPAQLLEDIKQGPNGTVTGVELYNGATRLAAATVTADTITITAQDETLTVRGQFANSFASVRPFWDKSAINDAFQIDSLVWTTAGSETARLDFASGAASLAVEGYRLAITGALANALPGPAGRSLQQVVAAVDLGAYNVNELMVTKANGDLVGTLSNSGSPLTAAQAIEGLRSVGTRLTQGSDRLDLGGLSLGIDINLTTGQTTYRTLSGPLPFTQAVEAVAGTAQADHITGNALANELSAGAGADTIHGGDGNDVLYGQTGNDLLSGDNGADTLYGNAGDDVLHGGAGTDWLHGGLGNDTFSAADGDTIEDLEDGETIQVAASVSQVTVTPGTTTTLAYDSDGNGSADATILLTGRYDGTFTTAASGGGTAITYRAPPPPPPSDGGGGGGGGGGESSSTPTVTAPVIRHETVTIPAVQPTGPDQTSASLPLVTDETGQARLQATVPAGVGMQVESFGTVSGIDGLLMALQRRVDPNDPDQGVMTVAGNSFAAQLPPGAELTVRTIVPTAPTLTSAPTQPIIITGQAGTAAGGTGLKQEAVVIDASSLPPGTVIQLQDIEFAAIVGAVRVTGGSGSQNLIADGSAQYIVLGADDDTLHGGGGDDFIGSEEGDDVLFGDDGLDTVTGGVGNDMLYGNRQSDVLYGNQGTDRLFGGQDMDTLFGGRDGDALYGNLGNDALYGNNGTDWLFGGQGDDGLFGGQGGDALFGNLGADALFGNVGDDTLLGNAGRDTLSGGDGADVFRIDQPADGGDTISDFQAGVDKIAVVGPNFGSIPAGLLTASHFALDNPATANAQFVFSTRTGVLSFDADGSGAGAAVTIATLNVRMLSASDIVVLAGP